MEKQNHKTELNCFLCYLWIAADVVVFFCYCKIHWTLSRSTINWTGFLCNLDMCTRTHTHARRCELKTRKKEDEKRQKYCVRTLQLICLYRLNERHERIWAREAVFIPGLSMLVLIWFSNNFNLSLAQNPHNFEESQFSYIISFINSRIQTRRQLHAKCCMTIWLCPK